MKTRQLVATSAVVSVAVLTLAELGRSKELPSTKQYIGFGTAFLFLSILSDFDLEFAGGLALLAMLAIVLTQGLDALDFVGARGSFDQAATPPKPGTIKRMPRMPQRPRGNHG